MAEIQTCLAGKNKPAPPGLFGSIRSQYNLKVTHKVVDIVLVSPGRAMGSIRLGHQSQGVNQGLCDTKHG